MQQIADYFHRAQRQPQRLRRSADAANEDQVITQQETVGIVHTNPVIFICRSRGAAQGLSEVHQIASGPRSPVRMRMQSSSGRIKILPSPLRPSGPVRPASMIALTVGSTKSSLTATCS